MVLRRMRIIRLAVRQAGSVEIGQKWTFEFAWFVAFVAIGVKRQKWQKFCD